MNRIRIRGVTPIHGGRAHRRRRRPGANPFRPRPRGGSTPVPRRRTGGRRSGRCPRPPGGLSHRRDRRARASSLSAWSRPRCWTTAERLPRRDGHGSANEKLTGPRSAGLRPASRGSAKPASTALRHANVSSDSSTFALLSFSCSRSRPRPCRHLPMYPSRSRRSANSRRPPTSRTTPSAPRRDR